MKKILFLTPYVPSSRAGGENYTRLLLEELSIDFKIDLIYYRYSDDPIYVCPNDNIRVVKEVLNSTKVKLVNALSRPFIHPIFSVRFDRTLLRFIKDLVNKNKYDLIYLDHSQMALYGKYFPDIQKVLMSHDVMAQRFSRKGNWLNRKFIVAGEKMVMSQPKMIVFSFSEKDREIIRNTYQIDSKVTHFFLDNAIIEAVPKVITKRIVFFGKWKRPDNFDGLKWFFDNVYHKIDKTIKIAIIGNWLPESFKSVIKDFDNVEYLGFVDNPYPLIANSIATISPLFSGAGVKVKVVESLACGTPVIGSDIAFEGIFVDNDKFMVKADSASDYVRAIDECNIGVIDRLEFKHNFTETYISESIPHFLNHLF